MSGLLVSAVLGACASSTEQTGTSTPDSGAPIATMDASVRECAIYDEGTKRACSCSSGGSGSQACLGGTYQPCRCAVPIPDAGSSGGGGNLCKAGFYSGEFKGKYKPGAFGLGIFGSPLELDVMGVGANGYPALSFTLEADEQGSGEFRSFSVKNGCMVGSAQVLGTDNPFVGRINGELDCRTGIFTGTIVGRYDMLSAGLKFDFAGTATDGQFEVDQARIRDGVWNVKEPLALDGTPMGGGGGTWSAIWESENPPAGEDPCASADLPDGSVMAPSDAGTTGTSDAGTTSTSDAGN